MAIMRALCWLTVASLSALASPAAAQLAEGGARGIGMGRAGAALAGQPWGTANPATWAALDTRRAALAASQAFGLSELRLASVAAAAPTPLGTVAVHARTYGFAERRETRVLAGLARGLPLSRTRRLDVGIAAGIETVSTDGYGSETAVLLDAGVQGDVLPGLRAGLAARNLLALGLGDDADLARSASTVPGLTVGLAYTPSDRALLLVDADHDLDFGVSIRAGIEVRVAAPLVLRAGASSRPERFSLGAGVRAGALRADLAAESHPTLGLTPAVSVEVAF